MIGSSPRLRQPLPTEALGKSLCVFRLGEAEHHKVAVIAAHGVREQRGRQDAGGANYHLTVLESAHLFSRQRGQLRLRSMRVISPLRRIIAVSPSAGVRLNPEFRGAPLDSSGLVRGLNLTQPDGFGGNLVDGPSDRLRRFGLLGHTPVSDGRYVGSISPECNPILPKSHTGVPPAPRYYWTGSCTMAGG
jgi:hypothetical protein